MAKESANKPLFIIANRSALSARERTLLLRLEKTYTASTVASVLIPLITGDSPVSLRLLDWAVVNWAKEHNIVCSSLTPGEVTNVHHAYRVALGYWRRRLFDPFRRRMRIGVRDGDGVVHETTLGQANFALWTYRTGALAYVLGHLDAIEGHMNAAVQRQKRARCDAAQRGVRRRRAELTTTPASRCVAYNVHTRVDFE